MNKKMIIVVDDNLVSRLLPSFILRSLSTAVQVIDCESGADALRMLEIHQVTHVLLDISMPNMDGVNVALKIRAIPKFSKIRLIAYTANTQMADVAYLQSLGFDDVLLKPIKKADLLHALDIQESKTPE
jgi:CheY-like chemotaxis protein